MTVRTAFALVFLVAVSPHVVYAVGVIESTSGSASDAVPRARAVLFESLESPDPAVRRAAVRMLRYAGDQEAFDAVQALFREFQPTAGVPGKLIWQDDAIETMAAINRDATLAWLLDHNDSILQSLDLYRLFSTIGFAEISRFDNVFWNLEMNSFSPWRNLVHTIAVIETGVAGAGPALRLERFRALREFEALAAYLASRDLSTDVMYYHAADAAGLGPANPVTVRSYTVDELLFQAWLYRHGYSDTVYRQERDLSQYTLFPSIPRSEALAYLYAGAPRRWDAATLAKDLGVLPAATQLRYVDVVLRSPDTASRTAFIRWAALDGPTQTQAFTIAELRHYDAVLDGDDLVALLGTDLDVATVAALLELIGAAGSHDELLPVFLNDDYPLVSAVAAGQILRAHGRDQ